MIAFLKKYKAFIIGLVVTEILVLVLSAKGIIIIDNEQVIANTFSFIFYWIFISLIIHKLPYLKENKKTVYKIIALLLFIIIIMVIDSNSNRPDNPITILLLVVFHLSLVYILVPKFFNKYKWLILGYYGITMAIFIYFRLFYGDFESYSQQKGVLFLLLIAPIPIFIGLWIYEQWKWVKSLQAEKAKAELSLLKIQINPHFFFNTLNNLYALTVKNSKQAPEVILKLSDMMRYTIYEGEKDIVKLKDEITYLENYIELHKIRYHKGVNIEFEYTIEDDDEIAPLLFIILLENALKHGVETLTENAFVKINLKSTDKDLHFSIENNFDPKEINKEKGIGLTNLKHRLSLIYPKKHQLIINEKEDNYKVDLIITKND